MRSGRTHRDGGRASTKEQRVQRNIGSEGIKQQRVSRNIEHRGTGEKELKGHWNRAYRGKEKHRIRGYKATASK